MQSTFLSTPLSWCWCLVLLPAVGWARKRAEFPGLQWSLKQGGSPWEGAQLQPGLWTDGAVALRRWRKGLSQSAALPELWNNSSFYRYVSLVISHFFSGFHSFKNMKVREKKNIVGFFFNFSSTGGEKNVWLITPQTATFQHKNGILIHFPYWQHKAFFMH